MVKSLCFAVLAALMLVTSAFGFDRSTRSPFNRIQQGDGKKAPLTLLDVPEIVDKINPIVVNIRSSAEGGENLGSGFIIDQRGLIVTNFHLISNTDSVAAQIIHRHQQLKKGRLPDRARVALPDGRQ